MNTFTDSVETLADSHIDGEHAEACDVKGSDLPKHRAEHGEPGHGGVAGKSGGAASAGRKVATRWMWNLPLLVVSLGVIGLGIPALIGLYYWQSSRVGTQLLQLADLAAAGDQPAEEAQWLRRYLSLRPDDVDALVRFATTYDSQAQQHAEIEQSRRHLTRALTALDGSNDAATEDALRRRLIDRLLQLGGGWYVEAERQIVILNPPPSEPQVLEHLAKSLFGQHASQVPRPVPIDPPSRDVHFWRWAVAQPVGEVLRMAVQANPDSVELCGSLIGAYLDHPELFASDKDSDPADRRAASKPAVEQATRLIAQLSDRQDDGRAQWLAYYYASRDNVSIQLQPLAVVAAAALQRLQDHSNSWGPAGQSDGAGGAGGPQNYQPFWDAQLVLAHAGNLAAAGAFEAAQDNYQSLVELSEGMLNVSQLTSSFLGLGQTHWHSDRHDAARQAWRTGNQRSGGESLMLLEPLAVTSVQSESIDEAQQDVQRLVDAIQAVALQLASRTGLGASQRDELQAQLNAATWRVDVLRAQLDYRAGNRRAAAQRLERALASQVTIATDTRIEVAELLATVYGEQKLWDLAARVLDEAALLVPGNRDLRRRAAAAWQQASAAPRAAEQWQLGDDGSFESGLAYAGAVATSLSAKPPATRDLKPLVAAINEAQQRLDRATDVGQSPAEAWRLALLRLSLPAEMRAIRPAADGGTTNGSKTVQSTADMSPEIRELIDLSLQYPGAAQLQAATAMALQRRGDAAAADEAVQRLVSISGVDPLVVLEVQSRLAVQRGATDEAVRLLQEAATGGLADQLRIVQFAAGFLRSVGRQNEALALLMKLDSKQHDHNSLLQLGELLLSLPAPSASGEADAVVEMTPTGMDVVAELQGIEDLLRQIEGEEGTHWRLLSAQRLLQFSPTDVPDATEKRRRLTRAAALQSEIVNRRPRWSRALALGGRIAAVTGNSRQAVELLRRAIAEGDKEATTVLLLVRQLNRLGELAAAEQELGRLEDLADSVGTVSVMSVGLALGQGKYDSALQRARSGVAARPNDPEALLVLAQAAAAVARTDEEQAEQLRSDADDALQRAIDLTRGRNLGVWQAHFRFQNEVGGPAAARQVLEAMQQSGLPDSSRFLAVASGYLTIKDWTQAGMWLEKAKQANPSDPNVALAQVAMFRATEQIDAKIQALEEANRLAPNREDIRRQLALALAAGSASDVPWQRINQLIGTDRQSTSQVDHLYHALILINRGNDEQIEQARRLLDTLMRADDPLAAGDAARLLVTLELRRWENASAEGDLTQAAGALAECRRLYELLVRRSDPNRVDLYRYGSLLLRAEETADAMEIADRLTSIAPASPEALDLNLRLAKQNSDESKVAPIVDAWLLLPDNQKSTKALFTASETLAGLGLMEHAVELLADAYQNDPSQLRNFVVALVRASEFERAITVCRENFDKDRSPEPIALLANVIAQGVPLSFVDDTVEGVFRDALKEFSTDVHLLEAIGTLRLAQHRYADAISLYKQSEKLNPLSLVTLNNMAVAFAELPGGHADALPRIERAVEMYGRNPELLDTLGVVQLRANLLAAAEATLREAYNRSQEPRHLFHLLLVLDARKQAAELQQLWKQLDFTRLNVEVLSPSDQEQLESLRKRLGMPSA